VFLNYLLLFLLTIIFLEIFFILIQTVKNKFSCHVLSKNAILVAPNFASYCGVRKAEWLGNDNRKTMIKVKTFGQMLLFEKRHGFAQFISSAWLGVTSSILANV
jgi:hypothetical protein